MMQYNTPYKNASGYPNLFEWYGHLRPSVNNTYNLGSTDRKWANIHGVTIYENGTSLANKYYLASNPNGYTSNTGTVTSVSAGTGLSISGTASTTPTINIANGYKLPTNTQWNNCIKDVSLSGTTLTFTRNDNSTIVINLPSGGQSSGGDPNIY